MPKTGCEPGTFRLEAQCVTNVLSPPLQQQERSGISDRVNFDFMHKVLEKCNFGPYFRRWIRILYKNPMSCILINQTISRAINLTRSVRQGDPDPLSPLLYVLILEPVLNKIRSDKEIKGIILPGGDQKKLVCRKTEQTS